MCGPSGFHGAEVVQIYKGHRNQLYVLYLKDQCSENRTLEVTFLLRVAKYHYGKASEMISFLEE